MKKVKNAFMEGIGNVIFEMREKAGIYQQDLCKGLCSCSTLSRLEWEGRNTSTWLVDALLQRLGKSQDNFWTIIHIDDFKVMEYRRKIWDNLIKENYQEAGKLIKEYESKVQFNKNLHMQFILRAKAFALGKGKGDWQRAEELLREAIGLTVEKYVEGQIADCLVGREEMEVLLLLAEAEVRNGKTEEAEKLVQGLLENIKQREWDEEELVKIYPKVMRYHVGFLKEKRRYKEVNFYARKAADLLAENGVLYLQAEFLEMLCWSVEQQREEGQIKLSMEVRERYDEWKKQMEVLKEIWKEYGEFSADKMIYCTNIQKDISLSSEIIYKCRKICGLSQRELSEDVCTMECLSRIENGKCSPQERKYRGLMEKMNWAQDRNLYFINAKEYELHIQLREVSRYINKMEYERAAEEWVKIRAKIPTDTLNNQQCILRHDTVLAYFTGKISYEEAMEGYNRALELTIPDWKNADLAEWPLSRNEIFLISNLLNLLESCKDKEKLKDIAKLKRKLKESIENSLLCENYHFVGYTIVLYNLSLTEMELGNVDLAYEMMQKGIKCSIRRGRSNIIPYFLYDLVYIMNEDNFKENRNRSQDILENAKCLCDLLKLLKLKQHMLEYESEWWGKTEE